MSRKNTPKAQKRKEAKKRKLAKKQRAAEGQKRMRAILNTMPIVNLSVRLTEDELKALVIRHYDFAPFVVCIDDYNDDPRELRDIPEVRSFCNRLIDVGLIALLEGSTLLYRPDCANADMVQLAWGAFEVWSVANWPLEGTDETVQERFEEALLAANHRCDLVAGRSPAVPNGPPGHDAEAA